MKLAIAITACLIVLALSYLAWAHFNGYDPTMCEANNACEWRHA